MTMTLSRQSDKPASRTLVIAGFIAATAFSGLVTLGVGVYSSGYQARLADRTAQVNRFVQAAEGLDPLVIRFVAESRNSRISLETRSAIKANLVAQRSTLESAQSLLSPSEASLAASYSTLLTRADAGLKKSTGPLDSQDFAQASADVAAARPKLYAALRG